MSTGKALALIVGVALIAKELPAQRPVPRPGADKRVVRPPGTLSPVASVTRLANLPAVTYGEPIPTSGKATAASKLERVSRQTVTARVGGMVRSAEILHLNGRQGIDNSGLPDGARRLLAMHVRKLPMNASQYYLVDAHAAAQWAATHPVPPEVQPKEAEEDDSDCGTISINGIVDCAEDAAQAVEEEFERNRKKAEDWWDESTEKLAKDFKEAASCFSDHTLPGPTTPVKFSISPSMTMDLDKGGSTANVKGSVTLGVPMGADFQARTDFFYVPCLPFVFRPKRIAADGNLTLGHELSLDVTAGGSFEKRFTIPPSGGARIPLYVIPIMIGDIPVAVLDVSAYIEGEIDLRAAGKATGKFSVTHSHRETFDFDCSGQGCTAQSKGKSSPTRSGSAQIEGQVALQPGIFAALQLSLNYNLLQARAGVQPYLLGVANGCIGVAQQSEGAPPTGTNSSALTADLDWGVKLRAEALAGGERLGDRWEKQVIPDRHIWFGDMAQGGSSALVPAIVATQQQTTVAQPSSIRVRMPGCYPYESSVTYRVTWTGGAAPVANNACKWDAGTGTCTTHPDKQLELSFTWQTAGAQSVSVQLVRDEHRAFSPAPPAAQLNVNVIAP